MSRQSKKKRDQKKKASKEKSSQTVAASWNLLRKISRDHPDVLQNIEFILVSEYRNDSTIDDRVARDALMAAISHQEAEDPRAQRMLDGLKEIRMMRNDISDTLWRDALRVVLRSVHNHSTLNLGSTRYLDFICQYII
jgi:hypothetical protein